jgi:hypothetical protein
MPQLVGICQKCRSLMPLTRHHIIPKSKGGTWDTDNIALVCRPCHDELDAAAGVGKLPALPAEHHRARKRAAEKRRRTRQRMLKRGGCIDCGGSIAKKLKPSVRCQKCQWQHDDKLWADARESLRASKAGLIPEHGKCSRCSDVSRKITGGLCRNCAAKTQDTAKVIDEFFRQA